LTHSLQGKVQLFGCPYCTGTSTTYFYLPKLLPVIQNTFFGLFSINDNMFLIITSDFIIRHPNSSFALCF
jgi:hypothetical protein